MGLEDYATPSQLEALRAVEQHGSQRAASKALGLHHDVIGKRIRRLKRRVAQHDPAEHSVEAPPGYTLRGVSTLLGADGQVKQQWVKTQADRDAQLEILREAVAEIAEEGRGRLDPLPGPEEVDPDTLATYPLADSHVGMLSWAAESDDNWDLKIAEETICSTADKLIKSAPPSERALLINLGDYFHSDNGKTTTKGTVLDVDGRMAKIAIAGMRIKRHLIDRLLQRHQTVEVWLIAGNHDENTAIWLAIALQAAYEREPRVIIRVDPARHQILEWGVNLIGACHGHTARDDVLPGLMAAKWPEEWGRTQHRVWYTGHVHHDSVKEHPGCLVETLRTVAVKDAWHAGAGYQSERDLKCDVWSRDNGRIARLIQRAV